MGRPPKPSLIGTTPVGRVPVFIAEGLLEDIGRLIRPKRRGLPLAVIIDRTVARLVGPRLFRSLKSAGWEVQHDLVSAGERLKSAHTIETLQASWFVSGVDRATTVLAVGGGTVTDTVGFAAATFQRGLPLWHVPTTIIGQVDAAIGGKVGINTKYGKNLIGCFYQPTGVVIDPLVLSTLPLRERRAGLAEIVKYAVIADPVLFRRCERNLRAWIAGSRAIDGQIIRRCVQIKLRIVARDEHDHGVRQSLNFGHTFGHALERSGHYRRIRHGEAVALGMAGAGYMSRRRGWLSETDFLRLLRLCALLAPAARRRMTFSDSDILDALRYDKKRRAGHNVWVLPRMIGEVVRIDDVTFSELKATLAFLRRGLPSDLEDR